MLTVLASSSELRRAQHCCPFAPESSLHAEMETFLISLLACYLAESADQELRMPAIMTPILQRAFRNTLELKLRRSRGDMLQLFLAAVMTKVWKDNFIPASAHYSQGDLKCDGLLQDPLTVFACYGPTNGGDGQSSGSIANAVAKVAEDFFGAIQNWPALKEWIFVSNYVTGTPPQITAKILELAGAHPNRVLKQFGLEQFRLAIFSLSLDDIEELLGDDATDEDFRQLQLPEVQMVINDVMQRVHGSGLNDDQPVIVPAAKLDFNNLPAIYQDRIRLGFQNAGRVGEYLLDHPDPTLDGKIASVFAGKYVELKMQGLQPDEIMDCLYEFTLGGQQNSTPREVAVWSLLAHLFEKCTIFEDHPVEEAKAL
ncbi:ABC-three component system protein [Bradyrhizobium sp. SYSU BS000235]|uniref:ABC-three component system protein n=1 Tax=Bradyrhizobium sp. SYSU BS000235 TaxID=3411332 RepID=UPI003C73C4F4